MCPVRSSTRKLPNHTIIYVHKLLEMQYAITIQPPLCIASVNNFLLVNGLGLLALFGAGGGGEGGGAGGLGRLTSRSSSSIGEGDLLRGDIGDLDDLRFGGATTLLGFDSLLVRREKSVGLSLRPLLLGPGESRNFRRTERPWSGLRE